MAKYSKEQRDRAVNLYIRYERCAADVIHELGYPSSGMLPVWYRERLEEERTGRQSTRGKRYRRYTDEQKQAAVDHYLGHGRRLKRTMRALGYPKSHELLTAWIDELAPGRRKLRHGPVPEELKREAVVAVASGRPESREAAAELGAEASVVGKPETADARRIQGDARGGDTQEEAPDGRGEESRRGDYGVGKHADVRIRASGHGGSGGHAGVHEGQTRALAGPSGRTGRRHRTATAGEEGAGHRDRDPEGHGSCRGKEPGADPEKPGRPREDAPRQDRWRNAGRDGQKSVAVVGIARSTYHYQPDAMKRPDKDSGLLELVREAFENSKRRYGYKRIHLELKGMGIVASAKRIMRLMTRNGLAPLFKSAKRYSSYKGKPDKAPKNLVDRDFHAERPNMPWVTDLTEFSIPAGKAYLSPVIDCHDGMPVAWTIGTSPDSALANGMLADACSTLKDGEKPIIHSDRGRHYRWPEWIRIRKDNNLTRSTGAKGCSPDNAAAEGFLGRIKQEFFHKRSFAGVTMDEFVDMLDDHMVWYRDRRIKTESGRGHHGPAARTRSCGMIGGEGINDESNKTSPAPSRNTDLTLIMVVPVSYRR